MTTRRAGEGPSPRQRLGQVLWRLADLTRVDDPRSFRWRAYREAVWALDRLSPSLAEADDAVLSVPRLGRGILAILEEVRETGGLRSLVLLEARYPAAASRLLPLPGMTPARLRLLKSHVGVEDAEDLRLAIRAGRVSRLPGLGPATTARWEEVLSSHPPSPARPVAEVEPFSRRVAAHLEAHLDGAEVEVTGAVRRLEEWVDRAELVVTGADATAFIDLVTSSALTSSVGSVSPGCIEVTTVAALPLALHRAEPREAGTVLLATTGPPEHVQAVAAEAGGVGAEPSEEAVYRRAGREWVPPPARRASFPQGRLAWLSDLRGDLHVHTTWSPDGRMSPAEAVDAAKSRGYRYLAITDHALGLRFGGVSASDLLRQRPLLEELGGPDLWVLQGAELNVDVDGSVGDEETLDLVGIGVAGIHSRLGLSRPLQTARLLTAIANPAVDVIAHPTTRRIGIRPQAALDLPEVVRACVREGVALEVNGHLDRLDLPAAHIRLALAEGALLAADSDAHRVHELGNVANSVALLQRAGADPEQVVNTWEVDRLAAWLGRRRGARAPAHP